MRRLPRATLAAIAALSLLSLVPGTVMAAQPVCGQTLMADTTLTADLDCSLINTDGLILGKNGIVLNLNGHTIWGFIGSEDKRGVYAIGVNHTKVKNGTVRDFSVQYEAENGADNVIRNVHLIGEAAEANDYGIYDYYSAHTVVDNVQVDGVDTGMYFEYSASGVVMNSDVSGAETGYYPDGATRMLFTGNSAAPASGGTGFYESSSAGSRYLGNTVTGGDFGFDLECNTYGRVILRTNTVTNTGNVGILLFECYNPSNGLGSIVTGNTSNGNSVYGFQDYRSYNSTWMYNVAKHNDSGFFFDYPGGVVAKFNVGNRNSYAGFEIHNSSASDNFAALSRNTANRNDEYGFYSPDYPSAGTGNVARYNGTQNCLMVSCVP